MLVIAVGRSLFATPVALSRAADEDCGAKLADTDGRLEPLLVVAVDENELGDNGMPVRPGVPLLVGEM
jgi:hypothetical protein